MFSRAPQAAKEEPADPSTAGHKSSLSQGSKTSPEDPSGLAAFPSIELVEHLSCACDTELRRRPRAIEAAGAQDAQAEPAGGGVTRGWTAKSGGRSGSPSDASAASTQRTTTTLEGKSRYRASMASPSPYVSTSKSPEEQAKYYQTCLACKAQNELCQVRRRRDTIEMNSICAAVRRFLGKVFFFLLSNPFFVPLDPIMFSRKGDIGS